MFDFLQTKTILFLEDNQTIAKHSIALFKEFVPTVHHAVNIIEAQTLLNSHTIDIIISDIKLDGENGLDFIQRVRKENPLIPIIIISGHKDEAFLFRSIPLNLTGYLLKPIVLEELIDVFRHCCEKLESCKKSIISTIPIKNAWEYNQELKTLQNSNELFILSKKEILFIELLLENRNRIITKNMIHSSVWNHEDMSDAALANFILRIRKRFGKDFVYTIPDIGYRLTL
jgi:two-component system, OmpR family, response regulator VanR